MNLSVLAAKVVYFQCLHVGAIEFHVSLDDIRKKLDLHSRINKIIANVHPVQNIWSIDKAQIDDLYQFA